MAVTLILLSQGRGEGVVMTTPIILLRKKVEGDHDLCHSPPEKLSIVASALLILTREGPMVVTLILLSQGRGEGVVMATPILLLGGRRQGDYGPLPPSLLGKWRGLQQSLTRIRKRCGYGPWPPSSRRKGGR